MKAVKTVEGNSNVKENFKTFFGESDMARFIELAELFEELEKTEAYKEIVLRIANFFSELERNEVRDSAYLFLGSVGPAFENPTFGMGDKLTLKAIAEAYGCAMRSDPGADGDACSR